MQTPKRASGATCCLPHKDSKVEIIHAVAYVDSPTGLKERINQMIQNRKYDVIAIQWPNCPCQSHHPGLPCLYVHVRPEPEADDSLALVQIRASSSSAASSGGQDENRPDGRQTKKHRSYATHPFHHMCLGSYGGKCDSCKILRNSNGEWKHTERRLRLSFKGGEEQSEKEMHRVLEEGLQETADLLILSKCGVAAGTGSRLIVEDNHVYCRCNRPQGSIFQLFQLSPRVKKVSATRKATTPTSASPPSSQGSAVQDSFLGDLGELFDTPFGEAPRSSLEEIFGLSGPFPEDEDAPVNENVDQN
jgi:hypothetical protein